MPPAGIEYGNVLWVWPFSLTGIGFPDASNTSTRPVTVAPVLLTSTSCVDQPPESANCGMTTAAGPPAVPACELFGVDPAVRIMGGTPETGVVIATATVLKTDPEKRNPITAKDAVLCMRKLPRKPAAVTDPKSSSTNFATCA